MSGDVIWGTSLRQTFRLLPEPSPTLRLFLEADGMEWKELLKKLPYEKAKATDGAGEVPDAKRYRDPKQVYQTAGLLYQDDEDRVRITDLGRATYRWLGHLTERNIPVLGRHAAYALAACQLRNPSGAGGKYDDSMVVFPFSFIWRAMLSLGGKLSSDELNQSIFRVRNSAGLEEAITKIREARETGRPELMGEPTATGKGHDDRIIPWMSLASFGWTLLRDKKTSGDGCYHIAPKCVDIVTEASRVTHKHKDFDSAAEYVEYLSKMAALPKDLR